MAGRLTSSLFVSPPLLPAASPHPARTAALHTLIPPTHPPTPPPATPPPNPNDPAPPPTQRSPTTPPTETAPLTTAKARYSKPYAPLSKRKVIAPSSRSS